MDRFLLDSDVIIWNLRGRIETTEMIEGLLADGGGLLASSALSVMEVWAGVRSGEAEEISALFSSFDVIPVDGVVARKAAGLLPATIRKNPRAWIDTLIAATAIEYGLTLVTYNRRHFDYPGLKVHSAHLS